MTVYTALMDASQEELQYIKNTQKYTYMSYSYIVVYLNILYIYFYIYISYDS